MIPAFKPEGRKHFAPRAAAKPQAVGQHPNIRKALEEGDTSVQRSPVPSDLFAL